MPEHIHFVGVGGVGMGTLAVAMAKQGNRVTGSDGKLYQPMKGVLESANVELIEGFKAENTELKPDLVVIGNVVRADNPEAALWIKKGAKFMSFPEAVRTFLIKDKKSIVCSGTHGKTTITSWVAFLLKELGLNPSYLIGGVPLDLDSGCVATDGKVFVGEGDEYDSAFFDKGPKFLHYFPHFLIISCIEFDHADIYKDLDHVKASFEKVAALLPGDGLCIANFEDSVAMAVAQTALCPVQTFGKSLGAMWRIGKLAEDENGFKFEVIYKGRSAGEFQTPLFGEHNLNNLLAGIIVAVNLGLPIDKIREVVPKFNGARRRQEILKLDPIKIVDDFAHHPTEVAATLSGVRRRYPKGKLWALFEPRSATARRNVHQETYPKAFALADHVLISSPHRAQELKSEDRLSIEKIVEDLKTMGKDAHAFTGATEIVDHLVGKVQRDDVIVVMSNGEFGAIQPQLVQMKV